MDFSELFTSFLFYLVLFVGVAIIAYVIRTTRSKSKQKGFRGYLAEHFPAIPAEAPMLMAKTQSKQAKPDIAMVMDESQEQVIILKNPSGKQIDEYAYPAADLKELQSRHKMIGRGFAPRTWSYEESLELAFADGSHHYFYLENVSNKAGTDAGADAVRLMFKPWREKLSTYLAKEEPAA
jgi:hypothetical protein